MPFVWTLQWYIFREMGKTFLLSAVALTGVLGLGGGVLNMIKLGDATPVQLFHLMALVLPATVALTLPIAALFSAAATYGRLSADNEFIACRSAGINLYVLFLPAIVLSVLSASITFVFINFVIPGMVRNLNEFIGADVATMIERRLHRPRGITLGGKFRIYADNTHMDASDPRHITLERVAFVEVEDENWVRYGTARSVQLSFDTDGVQRWVAGRMTGLSFFDSKANRFTDLETQAIRSTRLPALVPHEIKFLTLGELFYYLSNPDRWRAVQDATERLRMAVGRWVVYDALWDDWRGDRTISLNDARGERTIYAESAARVPREGGIELSDVRVEEQRRGVTRTYRARRATFEVSGGATPQACEIVLDAYEVRITDGQRTFDRAKETIGPIGLSPDLVQQIEQLSDEELFNPATPQPATDLRSVKRAAALDVRERAVREIRGTIHQRLAFSASVIVLVILAAALGIIFRGSHIVTAFGISFAPSLVVIITIVMGKQMSANAPTHALGLAAMWSGILLVVGLDLWTLRWVLRR